MVIKKDRRNACVVEQLFRAYRAQEKSILEMVPGLGSKDKNNWSIFPTVPGIYAITRRADPSTGFWNGGGNFDWQGPLLLYIGETINIRRRMQEHFLGSSYKYAINHSQFCRCLIQILQDFETVRNQILWSKYTFVAFVELPGYSKEKLREVQQLAIMVLNPRINVGMT